MNIPKLNSKTQIIFMAVLLCTVLVCIAAFSGPLQNIFVTLSFFGIFCILTYLILRIIWWLVRKPMTGLVNRFMVVVAVEITVMLMLKSASQLGAADLTVLLLIGGGILAYMRWRFSPI